MDVLLHNASGPYEGLPRTVGWGYPETLHPGSPISSLGIFASGNEELFHLLRTLLPPPTRPSLLARCIETWSAGMKGTPHDRTF